MKALKIVGVIILTLILLPLIAALFIPKTYHVERKLVIHAEPKTVFEEVNRLRRWDGWSPWKHIDTTVTNKYIGSKEGVGCKVIWESPNSENGSIEIVESTPYSSITADLVLSKFSMSTMHFTFKAVGEDTEVTWANNGRMSYPSNIFNPFADKLMGKDFEKGLKNLQMWVGELPYM